MQNAELPQLLNFGSPCFFGRVSIFYTTALPELPARAEKQHPLPQHQEPLVHPRITMITRTVLHQAPQCKSLHLEPAGSQPELAQTQLPTTHHLQQNTYKLSKGG